MTSPDVYAGRTVRSLSQAEYEGLERTWPAAYAAVSGLLRRVEGGEWDLDASIFDLVREATDD